MRKFLIALNVFAALVASTPAQTMVTVRAWEWVPAKHDWVAVTKPMLNMYCDADVIKKQPRFKGKTVYCTIEKPTSLDIPVADMTKLEKALFDYQECWVKAVFPTPLQSDEAKKIEAADLAMEYGDLVCQAQYAVLDAAKPGAAAIAHDALQKQFLDARVGGCCNAATAADQPRLWVWNPAGSLGWEESRGNIDSPVCETKKIVYMRYNSDNYATCAVDKPDSPPATVEEYSTTQHVWSGGGEPQPLSDCKAYMAKRLAEDQELHLPVTPMRCLLVKDDPTAVFQSYGRHRWVGDGDPQRLSFCQFMIVQSLDKDREHHWPVTPMRCVIVKEKK